MVQTGSRKVACFFVGPLVIFKAVGPNQFLLYRPFYYSRELIKALLSIFNTMGMYLKC